MSTSVLRFRPLRPTVRWYAIVAVVAVFGGSVITVLTTKPASAAPPVPTATLSFANGTNPLLGETVTFVIGFDNTDTTAAGYMPYFDLYLPRAGGDGDDGITFTSASYLGSTVATPLIQNCTGAAVMHPLTAIATSCPSGQQLVVLQLPFGSFTPNQPHADVSVTAALSGFADIGTPLAIAATGGFAFGDSPTGTTPIVGPTASTNVVPQVVRFTKRYVGPENETATGPNFSRQHVLEADVANGVTLTTLDLIDALPNTLQFLSATTSPGAGAQSTPSVSIPGGTLTRRFTNLVGTNATVDATATVNWFVPLNDAATAPVLDSATGDDRVLRNNGSATGTADPSDPRDANAPFSVNPNTLSPPTPDDHEVTAKSIATQKSVAVQTDVGAPGPTPGDTLRYTIDVQISDYFTFGDISVSDLLGDGQTYDATFTPTLSVTEAGVTTTGSFSSGAVFSNNTSQRSSCGDGASRLTFELTDLYAASSSTDGTLTGGLAGGGANTGATTARIVFQSIMSDAYVCNVTDLSVDLNDHVDNGVTVDGEVYDNTSQAPQTVVQREADTSGTTVTILAPALAKTIYARNGVIGDASGSPLRFQAGDTITYRLRYVLPSSDVEDFSITDYAPLPILGVSGFSLSAPTTACGVPASNQSCYGPADTFHQLSGSPDPTVTRDAVSNSLSWTYGDFDSSANASSEIDLLLTLPITTDPFRDGLLFTNQARASFDNSFAEALTQDAIVQLDLTQPQLRIRKGVVSASNLDVTYSGTRNPTGITFGAPGTAAPGWTGGTITTTNLAGAPNANATGADAGDLVRFAIAVENTGRGLSGAFDVALSDVLPAGFEVPAGGINLLVRDGTGTAVGHTPGGYYAAADGTASSGQTGTLTLDDPGPTSSPGGSIDPTDPSNGRNIVIVSYELQVASAAEANVNMINTATITNYAASEGGANYAPITPTAERSDTASVRIAAVTVAKTIVSTDHAPSVTPDVVIGEAVQYRVRLTVPEGQVSGAQLVDTLPTGMAVVNVDSITASPSVSTSTGGGFATVLSNTQAALGAPGQTITMALGTITNTDTDNAVDEVVDVTLSAVVLNVAGNQAATNLTNTGSFTSTGQPSAATGAVNVTVREPILQVAKSASPNPTDAGNTVTYTVTVSHAGGSGATAYDVNLTDVVPGTISYVASSFAQTAGTAVATTVSDAGAPTLTATWASIAVGQTATFTYQATVPVGIAVPFSIANTATTTWTSLPGSSSQATSYNTNEGERTGAGGVNDHTASSTATLTSANPTITKTTVATSESSTTGSNVTIGEVVTWDIRVTVPEGTPPSVTVTDLLPNGLQYVGGSAQVFTTAAAAAAATPAANLTVDLNGTLPAPVITGGASNGDDPVFTFGATTIAGDNDATNNSFVIRLQARVLDVVGNVGTPGSQTNLDNRASVRVSSGTTVTTGNTRVTVVEPRLQVTKTISPNSAIRGQNVTMTVAVQNTGLSTAFEVIVADALPAQMVASTAVEVATQSGFTYSRSGSNITWTGGDIAVGATATFQVSIDLSSSLTAGQVVTNTAIANQATTLPGTAAGERDEPDVQGQGNVNVVAPDLQLTKSDGTTTATPGDTRTYSLGITNVGGAPATGVVITDTLPTATTFVSIGGASCTLDGASTTTVKVINVAGTISANGGTASCTITVTMSNPAPAGTTNYTNVASVADDGTRGPDPTPGNNLAIDVDTITGRSPDLLVVKTDGVTSVVPGASTTYTVTVTNQGNIGVTGVLLTDTLPNSVTYSSCANITGTVAIACAHSAGVVTTTLSSLAGGASASMTITVAVPNPIAEGINTITNTVTVTDDGANGTDPTPSDRTATDIDTMNAGPDLSIVKTSNVGTVAPGGAVNYTLTVRNNGNQNATGVTVGDNVPAGMVVNCGSVSPAAVTCNAGTGLITWGPPLSGTGTGANPFAAGATLVLTYSVTVTNPTVAGRQSFTNTAVVLDDGTNGADPTPSDNSDDNVVTLTGFAVDLSVTKTDGVTTTTPGSALTYSIVVTNSGNIGAAGVTVTDAIPAGTTFTSCPSTPVTCSHSAGTVTWNVGTLAGGGAQTTLTLTVRVTNPATAGRTSLTNSVSVTDNGANGTDPTPGNNSATDIDALNATPDLRVVKNDGSQVRGPGDSVTYTLLVTNTGDQAATGVSLIDTLPAGTTFDSASNGGAESPTGTVTWSLGTIAGGGATASVTVTVQLANPSPAGQNTVVNAATVTDDGANGADPTPSNNTDSDTDVLGALPDLAITKTDGVTVLQPGDDATYTLTISNVGNQNATGVVITDVLPAPLAFTSCSNSCVSSAAPTITWPAISLAAGATVTRTVTATMPDTVVSGLVSLTNNASVTDDGTNGVDPNTSNNATSDIDVVDAAPDLSITKTDGRANLEGGDSPTYTLTIRNVGDQDATGVAVTDNLPSGVTFGSCSDGCVSSAAPTITWPTVALGAGDRITRTVTVTVDTPVATGTTDFVNNAAVVDDGANGADPTPSNNATSDRDTYGVDLAVTKTNAVTELVPGLSTTYDIVVRNLGPSTITSFTLSDPAPSAFERLAFSASDGEYNPTTGTWNEISFAPGDRLTLTASGRVRADATGTVTNTVTVAAPSGFTDPTPDNNRAADSDTLTPKVRLSATKKLQGTLVAGGVATYQITVTNAGPSTARGVSAADNLPNGLKLLDASGPGWSCTNGAATSTCQYGDVAPQTTTGPLTVTARVSAAAGTSVINQANVQSNTPSAEPGSTGVAVAGATETAQVLSSTRLAVTGASRWLPWLVILASVAVVSGLGLLGQRRRRVQSTRRNSVR